MSIWQHRAAMANGPRTLIAPVEWKQARKLALPTKNAKGSIGLSPYLG
jgi:hypothetical protein